MSFINSRSFPKLTIQKHDDITLGLDSASGSRSDQTLAFAVADQADLAGAVAQRFTEQTGLVVELLQIRLMVDAEIVLDVLFELPLQWFLIAEIIDQHHLLQETFRRSK